MEGLLAKGGDNGGGSRELRAEDMASGSAPVEGRATPTPEIMDDHLMLQNGLFCITFIIFFSSIPLFIALSSGLDIQLNSCPYLVSFYLLSLLFSATSSAVAIVLVMSIPPFGYHLRLACFATLLSAIAIISYFFLLLGFSFVILSMHFSGLSYYDLVITITFGFAALSVLLATTFCLICLLRRGLTMEAVLLRAVSVGASITVAMYAAGFVLQCVAMVFRSTSLALTVAIHVAIILTLVSMHRRGTLRLLAARLIVIAIICQSASWSF